MAFDPIPGEAIETLRDLLENGSASNVSSPMLEFLISNGYVEMEDGLPVVTDAGLEALGSTQPPGLPLTPGSI